MINLFGKKKPGYPKWLLPTLITVGFVVVLTIGISLQLETWNPAPIYPNAQKIQVQEFDNPKKIVTIFEVNNIPDGAILTYTSLLRENYWYGPIANSSENGTTLYFKRFVKIFDTMINIDSCPRFRLDLGVKDLGNGKALVTTTQTLNSCN